ncbi:HDOD domain-containing protein [Hahella sp. SMD15-11]|uniref:HDOD domain-containing protein n=1 Tax=Thermohahella caldifontis TaxID=3142973 RepID=A0AB39UVU1_9GAMM
MAIELAPEQINQILQGIKIPPQPQILVDLQMEQVMPDPDLDRIASLISQDVGLSGTILKFVNSPLFGLSNKITSIQQAVSLLGINSVINIVNGLAIKGEMSDETIVALTRFWDTATDIANIALNIARKIGYHSPDEAYTVGLFHNCGIPLMMSRFADYSDVMAASYAEAGTSLLDVENRRYHTNHAVIGYYTARSWNLPAHLCKVIADHHRADSYFDSGSTARPNERTLMSLLKLSEHICGNFHILGGQTEDHEWQRIGQSALEYLGLTDVDVEDLRSAFTAMGISVCNYR